jgi:hypothetical protein
MDLNLVQWDQWVLWNQLDQLAHELEKEQVLVIMVELEGVDPDFLKEYYKVHDNLALY